MPDERCWDAVVVGAGIGGLVCAAYLAASGRSVLVLEQHDVAGGNSQVFRRRRAYEFDVGVHYIGDCGPDGVLPAILGGVGLRDRLRFLPMDFDGFDRILLPGLRFDMPAGWDAYRRRLRATLPTEAAGLDTFLDVCAAVGREARESLLSAEELTLGSLLERAPTMVGWGRRTLAELFDHCGLSKRARTVLAAQSPNYGMGPAQATVALHASVTDHYLRGAYYPEGGGQMLAASLIEVIESHGGELRSRCAVERILVEDGRVTGVRLAGGTVVRSALVVSNADYRRTMLDLVGAEHLPSRLVAKTVNAEMALPLATLYLGLNRELPEQPNANIWWHADDDIDDYYAGLAGGRTDVRFLFMSFASIKDPGSPTACPDGHTNLQVMTLCPRGYESWGTRRGPADGERYRRDARYQAQKARLTAAMLDAAESVLGPFRDSIAHCEMATPLTHERYTRSTGGTPFGLARWGSGDGARPATRTSVKGLHVVGASTGHGCGISGVAVGGIACAGQILGRRLMAEVHAGAVLADPARLPDRPDGWDPLVVSRGVARRDARGLARIDRVASRAVSV
jgi:all-trans-retinol 13,14-reductase